MAAVQLLLAGMHGTDPWLVVLRHRLQTQPEPATHEEAVMPLARLRDEHGRQKVDVERVLAACRDLLAAPEGAWHEADWRRTHPQFPRKCALVIYIFTLQEPNVYTHLGAALHDPNRASGPGGVSEDVLACLPLAKLLDVALDLASRPEYWGFFVGQVFRGVKYAFPKPTLAEHDPESYFRVGRELHWFEFNSSSTDFEVMYRPWFCGHSGPRTVFTIQSCEGVSIKPFSALPDEEEVLFRPLAHFRVVSAAKRLRAADLGPNPPAHGGFPDDVHLVQLPSEGVPIPAEFRLKPGKEAIDFDIPALGSGTFADVRAGTYAFGAEPQVVAFKISRGSQAMDSAMYQQVVQEARMSHRIQHAHLIELFGILALPQRGLSLVLELAEGGSLRSVLSDNAGCPDIPWATRARWLAEVADGLQKLHSLVPNPIIHRDLKAANVLLSAADITRAVAKVCDFGVAKFMQTMRSRNSAGGSMAGTLAWKAPETFQGRYSAASDVFAFGIIAFEVLTRKYPFEGLDEPEIIEKTRARFEVQPGMLRFGISEEQQWQAWAEDHPLADRRPDLSQAEAGCPEELLGLVQRCWADEASARPQAAGCVV